MRLNWFLPALRRTTDGLPAARDHWLSVARRWIPGRLRSNHHTKRRGLIRRMLRGCGSSWLQSPLRRGVQTICFAAFVGLFFFVCWPYSASPDATQRRHVSGWGLERFDPETGELVLRNTNFPSWLSNRRDGIYLIDTRAESTVGQFGVREVAGEVCVFVPLRRDVELIQRVLLASGEWTVAETNQDSWPSHYADELARKERLPADSFLIIDPLVSISTAIAARRWVWSLGWAAGILVVCIFVPRGFCGYICPLGTLIDLFDWSIGRHLVRFRVGENGWWVHIKYFLLLGCLLCAGMGVLVTGYVAAIPVLTRGFLFLLEPAQTGLQRGWHLVPPTNAGVWFSICLFVGVLALGALQPRFWCKYVCPTGAVFSLGNLFRITERKVESSCIHCNKCIEVCPFDAIKADFTTRTSDCTFCQTCGGVCPTHAIKFVERGNVVELKLAEDPPTGESRWGRRGFLATAAGTMAGIAGAAGVVGLTKASTADAATEKGLIPVRPPGSVPEAEFLQMCIRCGECFKVCPNNVLQPMSFEQGLGVLWTPQVAADWAGCESSCNACGQVCPTGAIRALPLEEKRHARMGLAIVDTQTCLPYAGEEDCQLCVDECVAAGYNAIEFTRAHTVADENGIPVDGAGYLAPEVVADRCVGCGLCQTRCYGINVEERGVLAQSAIVIEAGAGREDRMFSGSYAELRAQRKHASAVPSNAANEVEANRVESSGGEDDADNPFGL